MNNLIIVASNIENFDLDLTDRAILGHYIKKYYGGLTVGDYKEYLTGLAHNILQSVVHTMPVENPYKAAQAVLLLLSLHEGLDGLAERRQITSFSNEELGYAMMEILFMYSSNDISTYATNATEFLKNLIVGESGVCFEVIDESIEIISNLDKIIKKVAATELMAA